LLSKIEISVKNRNLCQRSKFRSKIEILVKNRNYFSPYLRGNCVDWARGGPISSSELELIINRFLFCAARRGWREIPFDPLEGTGTAFGAEFPFFFAADFGARFFGAGSSSPELTKMGVFGFAVFAGDFFGDGFFGAIYRSYSDRTTFSDFDNDAVFLIGSRFCTNLDPKFFLNGELHIILKLRSLEIGNCSSFLNY